MLGASDLPKKYWSYAMKYAVHIYNSTVKSRFRNKPEYKKHSPTELVTGIKPFYDFLIFGCLVVARHPEANNLPFVGILIEGEQVHFLGFDTEHHGCYKYLHHALRKLLIVILLIYLKIIMVIPCNQLIIIN